MTDAATILGAGNASELIPIFNTAASTYNVPAPILEAVAYQETSMGGNPNTYVVGAAGELGVMQTTPGIVSAYGINPYDPTSDINGAAHYLSDLFQKTGSWSAAVAAYNGSGPAAQAYSSTVMANAVNLGFSDGSTTSSNPISSAITAGITAAIPGGTQIAAAITWAENNWIEILIVIGVIALLIFSIMKLFPAGSNSGGDTKIIPIPV